MAVRASRVVCVALLVAALLFVLARLGRGAEPAFDPATLKPFTEGALYLGKYETGLYPGGKNEIPQAHQQAGLRVARAIRPLDPVGEPDEPNGRILAVVLGHSNCSIG